ncbi:hypothetical protein ACA910_019364 [Epithemia clementina (nom. ined.)]
MDQADLESATTSTFFTSTINPQAFLHVQPVCGVGPSTSSSSVSSSPSTSSSTSSSSSSVGLHLTLTSIYLTCDSPGAYYQGSSTYRNSHVCTAGDKAQVNIALTIRETKATSWEQSYANELIYVSMESGFYNHYTTIFTKKLLCQMNISTETTGSGSVCPTPGKYYMQIFYDVPSYLASSSSSSTTSYDNYNYNYNNNNNNKNNDHDNDNYNKDNNNDDYVRAKEDATMHYTPDLRFIFTNAQGTIVGCASTGAAAWNHERANKSYDGMIALTIAVSAFLILFAFLLCMNHQRRKRLERLMERRHKAANRMYQYFKTLPNGQVVPTMPNFYHHHPTPAVGSGNSAELLQQQQQQQQLQQQQQQQEFHARNLNAMANDNPGHAEQQQYNRNLQPANSLDSTSGLDSNSGVAGNTSSGYQHHPLPHHHGRVPYGNHSHNNNTIPMISNPSYNETHLPTRPVI